MTKLVPYEQLLTGRLHVKYRKMPISKVHNSEMWHFSVCWYIMFFHHFEVTLLSPHTVIREKVHMFPENIWGQSHLGVIWGHWTLIVKICIIGYCIDIHLSPNQGSRTRWLPCVFWSPTCHDINAVFSMENIRVSSIMKLTMW